MRDDAGQCSTKVKQQRGQDDLHPNCADGRQSDRKAEANADRCEEQRQEEKQVDDGKPCQRYGGRQQIRHTPMGLEAAKPDLGAQLAGNSGRIAQRSGDVLFAAA